MYQDLFGNSCFILSGSDDLILPGLNSGWLLKEKAAPERMKGIQGVKDFKTIAKNITQPSSLAVHVKDDQQHGTILQGNRSDKKSCGLFTHAKCQPYYRLVMENIKMNDRILCASCGMNQSLPGESLCGRCNTSSSHEVTWVPEERSEVPSSEEMSDTNHNS